MEKKDLRKRILNIRNNIQDDEKLLKDKKILDLIIKNNLYINSKSIFTYVNFGSEVNTIAIIERALEEGKEIYVPKTDIIKKEMVAVKIKSIKDLEVGNYGMLEPKEGLTIAEKENFDLIIMPGAVFDYKGNRIGYGAGYYDKYLLQIDKNIKKLALAYELQILHDIPKEEHDIQVNYIITEERILEVS